MIPVTDVLRVHLPDNMMVAQLLTGARMDDVAQALLELVIDTASGRPTCAERNGEREVAIWKTGVTL